MSDENSYCCECVDSINKVNGQATRLWINLCTLSISWGEFIILKATDSPELRDLEVLGFLTSVETPPYLIIQLKCRNPPYVRPSFCKGHDGKRVQEMSNPETGN